MADENKKNIETIENSKQPEPRSLEPEEELSESDLEAIAGATVTCVTRVGLQKCTIKV